VRELVCSFGTQNNIVKKFKLIKKIYELKLVSKNEFENFWFTTTLDLVCQCAGKQRDGWLDRNKT
jgi:hypothetical protein